MIASVCRLSVDGKSATVDVLGEEITTEVEAHAISDVYEEAINALEHEGLHANISVKLTGLGLKLSHNLCRENLERLLVGSEFVRIDMEGSATTDTTLQMYRELRDAGYDNVGVVLQAGLRRTLDDIRSLAGLRPNVRLCKGIYIEPSSIAFTDPEEIRINYLRALDELAGIDGVHIAIATHDERLIARALTGLPSSYEFQMLLGVREDRASELVSAGHPMRVYVPFGEKWFEYSVRRLQENPAVAGAVTRSLVSRLTRG